MMVRYGDVCETRSDGSIALFDQSHRIGLSGWDIHLGKRLAAKEWQSPNSGRGERNCAQEYVRWDAAKDPWSEAILFWQSSQRRRKTWLLQSEPLKRLVQAT